MTLASAAFGFGQPLRPNLMFLVGVLALGPVLWWIRTLHIQIRRSRDHFLHVGFLSPPVSAQCPTELLAPPTLSIYINTCLKSRERVQVQPPAYTQAFSFRADYTAVAAREWTADLVAYARRGAVWCLPRTQSP